MRNDAHINTNIKGEWPAARRPFSSRVLNRRSLSLIVFLIWCMALIFVLLLNSRVIASSPAQDPGGEFKVFSHNRTHATLACLLCHRRESNAPRPKLPGHAPCAGCHAQQFANPASPVCTICHTRPEAGTLKNFPALRSFGVKFNHALHVNSAASNRAAAGCATCHRPENRGVALSIPAGFNAHTVCYQCHTTRAQGAGSRDISSCGTCHSQGRYARTPVASRAYRISFSHAAHGARQNLSCNDCHTVKAGTIQGRQVASPAVAQHFGSARAESCAACHNGKRAFGADDFTSCKRCHQGETFRF